MSKAARGYRPVNRIANQAIQVHVLLLVGRGVMVVLRARSAPTRFTNRYS